MKKNVVGKLKQVALPALVLTVLGSSSAFAQESTFTAGGTATNPYVWTDTLNWDNGVPNAIGYTANLSLASGNGGVAKTLNLASTPETIGVLDLGTTDGLTGGTYTLQSTGGAALTFNNSGSGAQINEISTSVGDTISAPIVLADNLTVTNSSTNASATFSLDSSITGTGNVTIVNNGANTSGRSIYGNGNFNFTGQLIFGGTAVNTGNPDQVRLEGVVGSGVNTIENTGASLIHIIGSQTISGTETYINTGAGILSIAQSGITGTGNIVLENNGSLNGGVDLSESGENENITGTITSSGTGSGAAEIGGIGSGVTKVKVASGAASGIRFNSGTITVNASNTTLEDDSSVSGATIQAVGGSTGTGDLILQNNGSNTIHLDQSQYNNTGKIINTGTGSGQDGINSASPTLGANVTQVVENSATSGFDIRLGGPGGFTGAFVVQTGTMTLDANSGNFSNASSIVAGDTAAHGAGSTVQLNMDSGTYTSGAAQTLSGFGKFQGNNITTVSGTTIAPGSTGNIGTLTLTKNLTLGSGTSLTFLLGTATASASTSTSSLLSVGGTLGLPAGTLTLNLANNAGANSQGSLGAGIYELANYNSLIGASAGDITSQFNISGPSGFSYAVSDTGTSAGMLDLTVTAITVPEPGTWALFLGSFCILVGWQRLRRRKA